MTDPIRVRYAPSPTGDFHVGGARTALFNYLFARHHGGQFILRIEDTDQKRYDPEALRRLYEGLHFLGLNWDEGPEVGGDYGPYIQTERMDIYRQYVQQLLNDGHAYRCFCSPERLQSLGPGYDRHCRSIDPADAANRAAAGQSYVIRAKLPLSGEITVHDIIRGDITFDNSLLQDAVLLKSDGMPTYHLANVVDDHLMAISHIMRGDEWVNSLPLHYHLYAAFGWQPPIMAHLPIILNPGGEGKMSKRESRAPDGRRYLVFVRSFQEKGYLPEAMVNYLALLGWSYDDKTEFMTRQELIDRFSLERVKPSPAAWDYDKLDHFNGHYIRQLSVPELTDRLLPYLSRAGLPVSREKMLQITPLIQERITTLSDVVGAVDFFLVEELPDYDPAELIPKKGDTETARLALRRAADVLAEIEFDRETINTTLRAAAKEVGLKAGQMFQPIRVAVCGRKVAPPLFETLEVLGRETALKRIDQALEKLERRTP